MAVARKIFRPPLWGTVGLVVVGGVCVSAGFWQIERAEQKREILSAFEAAEENDALPQLVSDGVADDFEYQRFAVTGRYDGTHQILLDNMIREGQIGYHVLTPLRMGRAAVLINRGWIPADANRETLPIIEINDKLRRVTGKLARLPRPGVVLKAPDVPRDFPWPRRLLFPTVSELNDQIGYQVYDYQLLMDRDNQDGFVRDWRPVFMSPQKHLAYSVQWFALTITLLVIYFAVNWQSADGNRSYE